MRRRFDPGQTLEMAARHRAAGLGLVPVMIERIVALPGEVRERYPMPALRFVTASGSRDARRWAVTGLMDRLGDVVYNHRTATEARLVGAATPADLRADPRSAGRPVGATTSGSSPSDGARVSHR